MKSSKKLVHGVGVNDADYHVSYKVVDEKGVVTKISCPFYHRWTDMLKRCYCKASLVKYPTYVDCVVSPEWLIFSNFKKWMEKQDWEGKDLDKDILVKGNKVYSPENCIFVTRKLHNFISDKRVSLGDTMMGVYKRKGDNKFEAYCCNPISRKQEYLGRYTTEMDAHLAWKVRKLQMLDMLWKEGYIPNEIVYLKIKNKYESFN